MIIMFMGSQPPIGDHLPIPQNYILHKNEPPMPWAVTCLIHKQIPLNFRGNVSWGDEKMIR